MFDYLIVGSGLFGSICARELTDKGFKVKVIEKRNHIGGNLYCENINGINVHKYGAHIFHTSSEIAYNYVSRYIKINNYINSPIAVSNGCVYNLPFNMNTFSKLWGVITPQQAKDEIERQKEDYFIENPSNLEEQAINLVGPDIYNKLIKGYTEKQWGRKCIDLPAFIIKRLPVRFTYDNNYFNDTYQGIPIGGYNILFDALLKDIDVSLNSDFFDEREYYNSISKHIIFTGPIDQFFEYKYGPLDYRTVTFENEIIQMENYQGNAVVNYTDPEVPFTRIIEHKHFEFTKTPHTVISKEYSKEFEVGDEPFYPVNDDKNMEAYKKYRKEAVSLSNVFFGGRLAEYKYYDMDKVILSALDFITRKLGV
ncbi:UDP-galactopyranose mutase [Vibrio cholerae]|uniref:UDP-galactopyranose mutase n=1 Tax=Vibrio cholerae TaxID=666 RepID=UPI0001D5AAC5|nr:UDP-galactopyranose mutase [Vibrio cholerae]EFH72970.1 UDP-galactopyranose mutase Glf [Vibrio cholerae RC385]OFI73869.1 UDP-galactopyranose mutase [Vibrio cholerae]OFI75041.1 UDP-galactopyranose mutase [Vibrio cholerae]TQP75349.1 UDP-galactopyranose mutase [Vibrio cholerae]